MSYLRARFSTNEEGFEGTKWPPILATLPDRGNYINGVRGGEPVRLKVDEISHGMTKHKSFDGVSDVPLVEIKLVK